MHLSKRFRYAALVLSLAIPATQVSAQQQHSGHQQGNPNPGQAPQTPVPRNHDAPTPTPGTQQGNQHTNYRGQQGQNGQQNPAGQQGHMGRSGQGQHGQMNHSGQQGYNGQHNRNHGQDGRQEGAPVPMGNSGHTGMEHHRRAEYHYHRGYHHPRHMDHHGDHHDGH